VSEGYKPDGVQYDKTDDEEPIPDVIVEQK
jgi:hypothetical protein